LLIVQLLDAVQLGVLSIKLFLKSNIFWDITPCSPLNVNRRFGGRNRLHLQDRKNKLNKKPPCHLLSRWFLAQLIFATLKMEAICSSETSVDTQRTRVRHIPEDGNLLDHCSEEQFLSTDSSYILPDYGSSTVIFEVSDMVCLNDVTLQFLLLFHKTHEKKALSQ
jgi:hypothetical protein